MTRTVFINGRFLLRRPTGVDRYALGILTAIDELLNKRDLNMPKLVILMPNVPGNPSWVPKNMTVRRVGSLSGQLWEQLLLPWMTRSGVLVNLCNTAPILKWRQLVAIHDATVVRQPQSFSQLFRVWYRLLLPIISHNAQFVVTVSRFSKSEIHECYGTALDKLVVIYNGVDHIARIKPDESVLHRLGLKDKEYILAVATNAAHKNVDALYSLVRKRSTTGTAVVLVGGDNNRVFTSRNDICSGCHGLLETGYVSDEELVVLYRSATCFVFPSLYEGFGLPPLEAMALGCPVVASNAAAMPEVLGDAAIYFDPDDFAGLSLAVKRVLNDEQLRRTLIRKGHDQANRYRWEDSARQFVALCEELTR